MNAHPMHGPISGSILTASTGLPGKIDDSSWKAGGWWTTDSREMLRPWKGQDLSSSNPAADAIQPDEVTR